MPRSRFPLPLFYLLSGLAAVSLAVGLVLAWFRHGRYGGISVTSLAIILATTLITGFLVDAIRLDKSIKEKSQNPNRVGRHWLVLYQLTTVLVVMLPTFGLVEIYVASIYLGQAFHSVSVADIVKYGIYLQCAIVVITLAVSVYINTRRQDHG